MGVRLIIMRKVKWTLIEFADLHGERHDIMVPVFLGEDLQKQSSGGPEDMPFLNWSSRSGSVSGAEKGFETKDRLFLIVLIPKKNGRKSWFASRE